ncbi:hypothetical protein LOTGIDRAFT_171776 [Lottia gigantea]|uniref:Uncharacterized protein n=1 Tax=Lottia gigantea TaxID=225164 RepID=V4B5A9_LOTGI|nr:hypothetical protein LOTGIDRAFT_171776 [Lottia gigantea]ESP02701.1 hypothetical protein LOTGIDRAFT_171776 [Lottia gigantea]
MIGWIKKRCNRRRSDPTGGKLKELGKGIKEVESDFPLYFTLENKTCVTIEEENPYEEVGNASSIKLEKAHNTTTKCHACPLCRRTSLNIHCSCHTVTPSSSKGSSKFTEEPIYELAKSPFVKSKCKIERSYSYSCGNYRRPLPEIPRNSIIEASSTEDACYGYESIGSDSGMSSDGGSEKHVYSGYEPVFNNQDDFTGMISDDSDYEEIETLPIVRKPRRCSLGPSFKFESGGAKSRNMRKHCLRKQAQC